MTPTPKPDCNPDAPATAYRDAEGWVLFDANRNVIEVGGEVDA